MNATMPAPRFSAAHVRLEATGLAHRYGRRVGLQPVDFVVESPGVVAVTGQYQGRPAERITLTPVIFNLARQVVFLVAGAAKALARATLQSPNVSLCVTGSSTFLSGLRCTAALLSLYFQIVPQ